MESVKKNRFLLFLIFLLSAIASPIFTKDPRVMELYSTITYTLILISGMNAFGQQHNFLKYSFSIFIITIILEWLQYFSNWTIFDSITPLTTSIVLILLLVMTLKSVIHSTEIELNLIYGVVSGYVLIGFVGGLLALVIASIYPDAFNLAQKITAPEATYFSFITMTTLGYGDITPAIQETRALAIILSIVGPMYAAIVIALMVGKFAAKSNS